MTVVPLPRWSLNTSLFAVVFVHFSVGKILQNPELNFTKKNGGTWTKKKQKKFKVDLKSFLKNIWSWP